MELIYIGAPYNVGVVTKDGSVFPDVPCIALYNRATKRAYECTGTARQDGGYDFTFSAELTSMMSQGVYALEIYNNDRSVMYKRIDEFGRVVPCRVSPDTIVAQNDESESESE